MLWTVACEKWRQIKKQSMEKSESKQGKKSGDVPAGGLHRRLIAGNIVGSVQKVRIGRQQSQLKLRNCPRCGGEIIFVLGERRIRARLNVLDIIRQCEGSSLSMFARIYNIYIISSRWGRSRGLIETKIG